MSLLDINESTADSFEAEFNLSDIVKQYMIDHGLYKEEDGEFVLMSSYFQYRSQFLKDNVDKYGVADDEILVRNKYYITLNHFHKCIYNFNSVNYINPRGVVYVDIAPGIKRRVTWKMIKEYFGIGQI